ncbi:MAG TPA: glycosyltransferase [Cytophagaceae bacterium]|jgi:glycosyltransferase involved in cell wall biosynthesis
MHLDKDNISESNPLISVIVLSWNHEEFIEEAINSIINQSYANIEIIYIDNFSSDKTFELAQQRLNLGGRRYKTKKFDSNIGVPKAVNYALQNMCTGNFIGLHSGDDWLILENFEKKMRYHQQNPQFKIVYSNGYAYYEDIKSTELLSKDDYCKEGDIFRDLLKINFLFTQGILIKKEVYDNIGLYNENCSIEDWDFSLKASKKYQIGYLNEPLFYWRRHSKSYSFGMKPDKFYEDVLYIINQYRRYPEHRLGVKWVAMEHIRKKIGTLNSLESLKYLVKYNYLIIPILRSSSTENALLKCLWKMGRPFKKLITGRQHYNND